MQLLALVLLFESAVNWITGKRWASTKSWQHGTIFNSQQNIYAEVSAISAADQAWIFWNNLLIT